MSNFEQAKAAIQALGTSSAQEANKWLVEFETSTEAWTVAQMLLLEEKGTNNRFYGANILYNKIRRDYYQLQHNAHELKKSLVNHILNLSHENPIDIPVIRRVCLALAALALQLNERGIVNEILACMDPIIATSPHVLLDLLMVLPEECYNRHIDVDEEIRHQFSDQLSSSAPQVLDFLCTFTSGQNAANLQTYIQLLKCLSRWVENTNISQCTLARHPILQFTLSALRNRDLFEEAVDVLVTLFRKFSGHECLEDDMALPSLLVPAALDIQDLWSDDEIRDNNHDDDVCRGICRVFTEMMESYLFVITQQYDIGQDRIMSQLLKCAAYPWDFDIARIPLKGFYELSALIKNCGHERDSHVTRFGPYFCKLLEITVFQMRLSAVVLSGSEKMSTQDEYTRDELNETVIDVIDVIGAKRALDVVLQVLQGQISSGGPLVSDQWVMVEACLSCIEVITSFLSVEESKVPLAQIMQFLITLPDGLPALLIVRNKIISRSAAFLNTDQTYLPSLMELVSTGLLSKTTVASSARAVMSLFKNCPASHGILQLDAFYAQICVMRVEGNLPVECDVDILDGLSCVISSKEFDGAVQALKHTIAPLLTSIQHGLDAHASSKVIMDDLERITVLLSNTKCRGMRDQHPVVAVFTDLWPVLTQVMHAHPTEIVCEKVCRCYKHFMRNTAIFSLPMMESMASHVVQLFQIKQYACFLYVASISIATIGESGCDMTNDHAVACGSLLVGHLKQTMSNMFQGMSNTFFTRHRSLAEFENNPDVVEEYFYLMARVLLVLPTLFVNYPEAGHVIDAGIIGLRLKHREAQKGILLFFERLVQSPRELSKLVSCDDALEKSKHLLVRCMPSLVGALLESLSGQIPAYALDESYGCISDVLWTLKQLCPAEFNACLETCLGNLPLAAQEEAHTMSFSQSLLEAPHQRSFSKILSAFENKCRRRIQRN